MTGIQLSGITIPTIRDQPWREKAKCLGQDWREYVVENMPKGRNATMTRSILAQAKCSGCPVKAECAGDALDNNDAGVIRAGIPITGSVGSVDHREAAEKLAYLAGRTSKKPTKRRAVWPRPCDACKRPMRPQKSTITEFPDTVAVRGKGLCRSCAAKMERES